MATEKKPRQKRAPADPKAALELRVVKAKAAIRGLAKKFPNEMLDYGSVNKIITFLRSQVDGLERDLNSAVSVGSAYMGFSFDMMVPPPNLTQPAPPQFTHSVGTPGGTVPDQPVRLVKPTRTAPPEPADIDFIEE